MAFPQSRLDVRIELAFGATGAPSSWIWTDVSDRFDAQTITIRKGQPDGSGSLQSASVSVELDNRDGWLMPDNGNSPWWPNVQRGTPLRISVEGGEPALALDGTGWAATPDHVDLGVPNLDLRVLCQPDAWAAGVFWSLPTVRLFSPVQHLLTRWGNNGERSFSVGVFGAGWPFVESTTDGTGATQLLGELSQLFAGHRPVWFGLTFEVDDGAGNRVARAWRHEDPDPPADIFTWELIGTQTTTGTTSIFDGSTGLQLGARNSVPTFAGRILRAQMRSDINGTLIADPDFTVQQPGTLAFADSTGKLWTLNGGASISTRRTRFVGTIDEILPTWPAGDNAASSTTVDSDSRVQITASDLVRRLRQGSKPLRSSLYRLVTSERVVPSVFAYWPCEDEPGAARLAAGLTTHGTISLTGKISTASASDLTASAPLPLVGANETASFVGTAPTGSPDNWVVEWVALVPTMVTTPSFTRLMTVKSEGTAQTWHISANSTQAQLEVLSSAGAVLETSTPAIAGVQGEWTAYRLDALQNGANIDWTLRYTVLATGFGGATSDTFVGTLGRVTAIDTTTTAPSGGMAFGHIVVHDGQLTLGWQAGADTAWVGESAAHRIWRLCVEEGVPVEVVGEWTQYQKLRGELLQSEALGPQARDRLLELVAAAAAVDLGVLTTRRSAPGFLYRTRQTIENQATALELDAAANHIINPLRPALDDQRLRNDVTVTSRTGSSARVVDAASVAAEGLYDTEAELNAVGGVTVQDAILGAVTGLADAVDGQNEQQASWRLTLGTWPGLRYPSVVVDLGVAPDLIPAFHDLEIGDRVTLRHLPAQHPDEEIDLLVEGISERLSPTNWTATLTCSPGGPWLPGVLDGDA